MRWQFILVLSLLLCFCGEVCASAVGHANSLANGSSYSGDKLWFGGKSYGCELLTESATYEYSDGDIIQALSDDMWAYKCKDVSGANDKWEWLDTRYCEDSPINSLGEPNTEICVYVGGEKKRCKTQGEYFDNSKWEAWKNGCVKVERIGAEPEEPQEINDESADAIEHEEDVETVVLGGKCAENDLSQFAIEGVYISASRCAATKCRSGTYLVMNSAGASQGWCVAESYCQTVKGMDKKYKLTIIDGAKTDLTCSAPDSGDMVTDEAVEPKVEEEKVEEEKVEEEKVVAENVQSSPQKVTVEQNNGTTSVGEKIDDVKKDDTQLQPVAQKPVAQNNIDELENKDRAKEQSQQKMDDLKENAQKMKDKEQSAANKVLGAAGIGAAGIGGMKLASGLAEQAADKDAEAAMRAYLATFHCNYGDGKNIAGGTKNVEIPGGNELIGLYSEYVNLANNLKMRKTALGLRPGVEAQPILDAATSGLYDDVAYGKTSGAYVSLARALMYPDGEDAKAWAAQKSEAAKNVKDGAITAGVGAGGSAVGSLIINHDKDKKDDKQSK